MFTGIVEDRGQVESVVGTATGARITVATMLAGSLRQGDSLAVNGVCLTAVDLMEDTISFDVVHETLDRSNLGSVSVGDVVNLERPLAANGRFDGHIVQGHVDTTGSVERIDELGEGRRIAIAVEERAMTYIVEKGSITVNGVSLTVASVTRDGFELALIPHTLAVTNLSSLAAGDAVNIEVDVIAKYVEKMLERRS